MAKISKSPKSDNLDKKNGGSKSKTNNPSILTKKVAQITDALDSDTPEPVKIGSNRGIESMFRNSYRAQLDMIALAATKANIMISLNGFLVSMLLLSGTFVLLSDPLLLIPLSLFLVTCTTAIIFAVLAARPVINKYKQSLEEFRNDEADLLIFDQFASLSSEDYALAMQEMMLSNERVYNNMISHIYHLGCTADRKFSRLYVSYSAFIVGLVISVISLLLVMLYRAVTSV